MKKEHLPLYGPGPLYVGVIAACTAAAALCARMPALAAGRLPDARGALTVLGVLLILAGVALWIYAVPVSKIDDGILENRLVTSGAYAWVRNPIYSAFMLACDGALAIVGNLWFMPLPLFYWLFLTLLMRRTEEKWLLSLYGREYAAYCARVNRCWPVPPKKGADRP